MKQKQALQNDWDEQEKNSPLKPSKTARKVRKSEYFFTLIGIIFAVLVCVVGWLYFVQISGIRLKQDVYVMMHGTRYDFSAPVTLNYRAEDGASVQKGSDTLNLNGRPLYVGENELYLSTSFVIPDTDVAQCYRLPRFAHIVRENGTNYYTIKNKKHTLAESFFFDGANTYVFLMQTTITVGEQKIIVPPFSYAVAVYNRTLEIVNAHTGESVQLTMDKTGAVAAMGDISVDLNLDILTSSNGTRQILPADPSFLPGVA